MRRAVFSTSKRVASCIFSPSSIQGSTVSRFNAIPFRRHFSVEARKLLQTVNAELQHEKSQYSPPDLVKKFLQSGEWTLEDKERDVNITLTKKVDDRTVSVAFQLVSPYQNEGLEGDEDGESEPSELTDFSVTVEKSDGSGVVLYCSTFNGDPSARFLIGSMKVYESAEQRDAPSSYNGPVFEDLDQGLQEAVDGWLSSLGVNHELCDFIDACAVDKEQREYMGWLNVMNKVISN